MLSILLLILKIIGIILLAILLFILAVLFLILFVPIRYKIKANRTGISEDPPVNAVVQVSWLMHLLHVKANYPGETYVTARILGFPVFKFPEAEETKKKKADKARKKAEKETSQNKKEDNQNKKEENNIVTEENSEPNSDTVTVIEEKTEAETENAAVDSVINASDEKKSIFDKINSLFQKIKETIELIKDKITHIQDTITEAKENASYYIDVLQSDTFKESLDLAMGELKRILKSIKPRKCRIYVEEGMADPATTAQILAIYGMFYPLLYKSVSVVGNFEEEIIKADVYIKGHITIFVLVYAALKLFFSRKIRKMIALFKKEDKKHGRK